MDKLKAILQQWPEKTIFGVIFAYFSSVCTTFLILLALILMDTVTGITQALQMKRFSSRLLRKAVKKIFVYSLCIVTTRLMEQGFSYFFQTTVITQTVIGFLIVTEALSILENLTLMGAPLPKGLVNIILSNLKVVGLESMVKGSLDEYSELTEIDEIIYYQIPTLSNDTLIKLLRIKYEQWERVVQFIKTSLESDSITSNDVLFYKVSSYLEGIKKEMVERWNDAEISKECIDNFNKWHEQREVLFLQNVKNICYSDKTVEAKKQELIDRIMVLLYQTMVDAHKSEQNPELKICADTIDNANS
jgi:toxin secretion/phage lysis holin